MPCLRETSASPEAPAREAFMRHALGLALRGRGATAPNPCVGAVLVKDGCIVAEGWHSRYGGPHAERECLADARSRGVDPAGCDLYVTLEPCNHHGKTPPCTEAVLEAGIRRVFVGCFDPNPDVAGGGATLLREKGVDVVCGVLEQECRDLVADFVVWKTTALPHVTLKLAATLDGRIAARGGRPEAVSCPESQRDVHMMRSRVQAVMVGGTTFYSDDPRLTCRLNGLRDDHPQPLAVVVTRRLPKAVNFTLLRQSPQRAVFLTGANEAVSSAAHSLEQRGCRVWSLPRLGQGLDLAPGLMRLRAEAGVHSLLCEGGGHLALSLLEQGLVHEFVYFLAPAVLGDDKAKSAFAGREARNIAEALPLRLCSCEPSGRDLKLTYRADAPSADAEFPFPGKE